MHRLILHVKSNSHPLWQVHAQSHLTRHMKIPPPLASTYKVTSYGNMKIPPPLAGTCTVSSYTSNQTPTPSGKYMHSLILHVISKSHPLWQVHAQSHLTGRIKIPLPLASTCKVTSYITRSKSHPLWQVHAQSHLTRHIRIPPPLVSTCTVSSYTSYQNPTPSGKYMQGHILHVISKSHPLWQVHAQSHLTRHIKIPPPLASTYKFTSYGSYKNPTPSGKHIQSHILRFIWKSHPLWQAHTKSHLTVHMKIPPLPDSLILHVISKSHPLWQVHARSHLTRHIKIPPPLAGTCTVSSYTSYQNPTPSGKYMHSLIGHVYGSWFMKHSLQAMVYESWFTKHGLRAMVYESWFTKHGLRAMVYESWFTKHSLRAMVYESWFTKHGLRAMVYRSRSQPYRGGC